MRDIVKPNKVKHTFDTHQIPMASIWIYNLHNLVNLKLNKPQFSMQEFDTYVRSNEFQAFPLSNLQFIESAILYCLRQWPSKRSVFTHVFSNQLSPLLRSLHTYREFANISSTQARALTTFSQRYQSIRLV